MKDKGPTNNKKNEVVETRIATVYRDDNGVIVVNMKECDTVDEFDVMDLNLVIRHAARQQMALKFIIATASFNLTKKAKEMAKKEDNLSKTIARAVVVSNTVAASWLNFFKQFGNKSYPMQFFTDKEGAYEWLLGFSGKS